MLHPGLLTLKTAILALVNAHARIHYVANEMGTSYFFFNSSCYITARDYNLPSASNEAGTNVITDPSYLQLQVIFHPHQSSYNNYVTEAMGESKIEEQPFGSIQQTVDMIRSRSIDISSVS